MDAPPGRLSFVHSHGMRTYLFDMHGSFKHLIGLDLKYTRSRFL